MSSKSIHIGVLVLFSLLACTNQGTNQIKPVEKPEVKLDVSPVPPLTASTPTEALMEALRGINAELMETRKEFAKATSSYRTGKYEEAIKRLESDRMKILRVLGEQQEKQQNQVAESVDTKPK